MRHWKKILPFAGTALLIGFIVWRISPREVARAMSDVQWPGVVATTAALALATFFWDGVCLGWLFRDRVVPLSYKHVLQARGSAYLGTLLHFGIGQGILAWQLAKRQQKSLLSAAVRCAAMAYVDLWVLLGLGLMGASLSDDPRTRGIGPFCLTALLLLAFVTLTARFVRSHRWLAVIQSRWLPWWVDPELTFGTLFPLYVLRLIYFVMGLIHVTVILAFCGFRPDRTLVLSVLPITALVDALPLSISGLGTREAMLLAFLQPEQPARLVACTLLWWTTMLLSRAAIGFVVVGFSGSRLPREPLSLDVDNGSEPLQNGRMP